MTTPAADARPSASELAEIRDFLLPLATELGRYAQGRSQALYRGEGGVEVNAKTSPGDVVTSVDLEVQERLVAALSAAYPDFGFLGEEAGLNDYDPAKPLWVIDPIDGTLNFVRAYPGFCVAIALVLQGEVLLGVIYDAATDLLYSAWRGGGAWRHVPPAPGRLEPPPSSAPAWEVAAAEPAWAAEQIRAGAKADLGEAVLTTGFTKASSVNAKQMAVFAELAGRTAGMHISGSAARDTCFVASGKVDAYWQFGIKPWDVACSLVLVSEAGGRAQLRHSGDDWLKADQVLVMAGSAALVAEIEEVIDRLAGG